MTDPIRRRSLPSAIVALMVVLLSACAAAPPPSSAPSLSTEPVVRTVLASGAPATAPMDQLALARYTIQPGTKLATHRHPGMQLAFIEAGTLTYTVVQGAVTVHQADGATRLISAGQTGKIAPGEWIVEDETIVHFGANEGPEVVVILASSLLEADEPPAIPVTPAPT
jgi:quercetin dioxygenase-like cupin family protein